MSEDLLKDLLQLFAILGKLEASPGANRPVVEQFLRETLQLEEPAPYLEDYDQHALAHRGRAADTLTRLTVRDSARLLRLCTQINDELNQRQRIMVLMLLFGFISQEDGLRADERDFLVSVADVFNVTPEEFTRIEAFALGKIFADEETDDMVVVTGGDKPCVRRAPSHRSFAHAGKVYEEVEHEDHCSTEEGYAAVLRIASTGMYLARASGKLAMYLNGSPMREGTVYQLDTGASLRGVTSLGAPVYYSDIVARFMEGEARERITFEAKDVCFSFGNGKVALHKLSLAEESGRLVGLMGPSGAGKSTLLEVLNGNLRPTHGKILINGRDMHASKAAFKGVIGYVPQDDLLIEELTVFENLFYSARLCFGDKTETQLSNLVDRTLISLGLKHIRDLRVGSPLAKSISGGERKRVNIGLELLRAPQVLFVDEPTSGLSSRDSVNVMELLKDLAEGQGKLVFVVIHQPSSDIFKMFDKLVMLDTGGYMIYQGNPVEAIRYFKARTGHVNRNQAVCHECGNVNPEQIFDIVETRLVDANGRYRSERRYQPKWWHEQYKQYVHQAPVKARVKEVNSDYRKSGYIRQLMTFIRRDVVAKLHNNQYLAINLLEAPALALLLSWVFRYHKVDELTSQGYVFQENDNIPVYLFISIIVALFLGLTVSAEEIFKDRRILKRESFLHLSRHAYLLSKVSILFALSAAQCFMFVLIGNQMLEIKGLNWEHWLVLFSSACFANLVGLNISATFNSAVTIYIMIPILLIPQLVLGGLVIRFDQINPAIRRGEPVPVYGEVMASRWAFEALLVSQYMGNPYEGPLYQWDKTLAQMDYERTYLLPALEGKVEFCDHHARTRDVAVITQIDKELAILSAQLKADLSIVPVSQRPSLPPVLSFKNYSPAVSVQLREVLGAVRNQCNKVFNRAYKQKDHYVTQLTRTTEGAAAYVELSRQYSNSGVLELVKNTRSQERIAQEGNRLVQKIYPVFNDPQPREGLLGFRTHFFAPVKWFAGRYWSTLCFNVGMIWVMVAILYATLYHGTLSRLMKLVPSGKKS